MAGEEWSIIPFDKWFLSARSEERSKLHFGIALQIPLFSLAWLKWRATGGCPTLLYSGRGLSVVYFFFFSQFLQLPDALADRAVKSHLKDKGIQSPNFPLTVLSELNQGVSYVRYLAPNQGSWRGKGGFSCLSGKTFPLCCCFQWHLEA